MIPEEWPSIRSIARCVLPVLVGPSTAVTPEPGARSDANVDMEEKAICQDISVVAFARREMDWIGSLANTIDPPRREILNALARIFERWAPLRGLEIRRTRKTVSQCDASPRA